MSKEQQYYEMLTRTDHPVFKKDYSLVQDEDSPFNSVLNRIIARQLCKIRDDFTKVSNNSFVPSVDDFSIDKWEETHFGFTKPTVDLPQRVDELQDKVNNTQTMSLPDVILTSEVITGITPIVVRNLFTGGWVLDEGVLDLESIFGGSDQSIDSFIYLVIFLNPVDSLLLDRLDKELTKIEKAGCKHVIISPIAFWLIDESALGIDTIIGE